MMYNYLFFYCKKLISICYASFLSQRHKDWESQCIEAVVKVPPTQKCLSKGRCKRIQGNCIEIVTSTLPWGNFRRSSFSCETRLLICSDHWAFRFQIRYKGVTELVLEVSNVCRFSERIMVLARSCFLLHLIVNSCPSEMDGKTSWCVYRYLNPRIFLPPFLQIFSAASIVACPQAEISLQSQKITLRKKHGIENKGPITI